MKVLDVMKKENVGKKYKFKKDYFTLIELNNKLYLETEHMKDIEEMYSLHSILTEEFEEVIDWSKIPVDTKVLVSKDNEIWHRRYFAKFENGKVYFFSCGASSFSADDINNVLSWEYVKLYQE